MISIGQPAPDFTLPDLNGHLHSLLDYRGRVAILNFWSAECPQSARVDAELLPMVKAWGAAVALLSIAANANEGRDLIARVAAQRALPVVLLDSDHKVADLYEAQTTPHLFVVDAQGILRYQGAFDDVTFRQRNPTRNYLRQAVEAVLAGQQPPLSQTSPYGCTIVRHAL
jgi:peroxiredoxin